MPVEIQEIRVEIAQAAASPCYLVDRAIAGDSVVLLRDGVPMARIVPVETS